MLQILRHLKEALQILKFEDPHHADGLLEDIIHLKRLLPRLPRQDKLLIRWIGLQRRTESQVAKRLGITQQAVHQRLASLAARLVAA